MFTVLKSETLFPEESFAVKVYVSVAYILLIVVPDKGTIPILGSISADVAPVVLHENVTSTPGVPCCGIASN